MSRRRARGNTPLTPERVIEDFTAWLIAGGFSHEAARSRAERIRAFHRETGMNFLAMTPEELVGFIAECDYRIVQLRAAEDDPEEPGHWILFRPFMAGRSSLPRKGRGRHSEDGD